MTKANEQVIPDAAVEAAYRKVWQYFDEPEVEGRGALKAALEAAAPHLIVSANPAIEAVLAIHAPQGDSYKTCSHCIRPSGYPNRGEQPVRWPCPTAAAIEASTK